MQSATSFQPFELQQIEPYDPENPMPITHIGGPVSGFEAISNFLARAPREVPRTAFVPAAYGAVFRITNDRGEVEFWMAKGFRLAGEPGRPS